MESKSPLGATSQGASIYQPALITKTEGQRAFPSLTSQKTASFSLDFRAKPQFRIVERRDALVGTNGKEKVISALTIKERARRQIRHLSCRPFELFVWSGSYLFVKLLACGPGRDESHPGDTGMRGYDLPAVVKFLEVHGAISHHRSAWNSGK